MKGSAFYVTSVKVVHTEGVRCDECGLTIRASGIEIKRGESTVHLHSVVSKGERLCMQIWTNTNPEVFDLLFPFKPYHVMPAAGFW